MFYQVIPGVCVGKQARCIRSQVSLGRDGMCDERKTLRNRLQRDSPFDRPRVPMRCTKRDMICFSSNENWNGYLHL
ncbi:hypothetical protein CPSG_03978 [Coccidioides posadasii str. Silveira]|uniref:Uncharacterized protein n=1 Tax=Coccidioides posadasii (strain RMSCC 757 / Silveira) TaxID=443226 RepID=E9D1C0_COCPS|nr:hypothetical protein CPSG_03978 [Coccidioides posadasii str. Silveira]